jgi:hypothetical protein
MDASTKSNASPIAKIYGSDLLSAIRSRSNETRVKRSDAIPKTFRVPSKLAGDLEEAADRHGITQVAILVVALEPVLAQLLSGGSVGLPAEAPRMEMGDFMTMLREALPLILAPPAAPPVRGEAAPQTR